MRLIGGNISDTPLKQIGDGSAFNVGGGAWWETKQAALDPDPHWDDVAFLFQPHPDDVNDSALQTSTSPDRKTPSWNWTINRNSSTNATRTHTRYAEFEALDWAPMGAGFFKNAYSNLVSEHNMQDVDLIQDWCLEIVWALDPQLAVPHGSGVRTYGIPNTGGLTSGINRAGPIRNGGTGYVYCPAGSQQANFSTAEHDGEDYSHGWMLSSQGMMHEMICYDHSATRMGWFINGIMCKGSPRTSANMSSYNRANAVCASVGHTYNATSLSAMTEWTNFMGWCLGYRLTLADRYSWNSSSAARGLPALIGLIDQGGSLTFPERGA